MASTAGAHALAPQLDALGVEMASYKRERQQLMAKIEQLEQQQQQQPTDDRREELKRLHEVQQSLLDLIKELQRKENLLLGSSAGAAAGKTLLGSDTFKAGMSTVITTKDLEKALEDQKADILESLGNHRHLKAH